MLLVPTAFNLWVHCDIMDYRKPSKKVIVDAVVGVLKERGSVDTQTKLHRKVVEKLKEEAR